MEIRKGEHPCSGVNLQGYLAQKKQRPLGPYRRTMPVPAFRITLQYCARQQPAGNRDRVDARMRASTLI